MKGVVVTIMIMFMLMWGCATCVNVKSRSSESRTRTTTNINVISNAADGLDLKALGEVVKQVKSAEELEKELNKSGGINNLDLNDDGKVDFITVTEYGNRKDEFGFSLTVEPVKGEVQEIATIQITKQEEQVEVQVSGNDHVYGHGHHYRSHHSVGTFFLMGYLLGGHSFYRPYWGWGAYPGYYRSYGVVNRTAYVNQTRNYTRNSTAQRSSSARASRINNPNKGKVAKKGIKKSLANPTRSQKSFQARNASKPVKSGGFGRSSKGSARSRGSSRSFGGRGK